MPCLAFSFFKSISYDKQNQKATGNGTDLYVTTNFKRRKCLEN